MNAKFWFYNFIWPRHFNCKNLKIKSKDIIYNLGCYLRNREPSFKTSIANDWSETLVLILKTIDTLKLIINTINKSKLSNYFTFFVIIFVTISLFIATRGSVGLHSFLLFLLSINILNNIDNEDLVYILL